MKMKSAPCLVLFKPSITAHKVRFASRRKCQRDVMDVRMNGRTVARSINVMNDRSLNHTVSGGDEGTSPERGKLTSWLPRHCTLRQVTRWISVSVTPPAEKAGRDDCRRFAVPSSGRIGGVCLRDWQQRSPNQRKNWGIPAASFRRASYLNAPVTSAQVKNALKYSRRLSRHESNAISSGTVLRRICGPPTDWVGWRDLTD